MFAMPLSMTGEISLSLNPQGFLNRSYLKVPSHAEKSNSFLFGLNFPPLGLVQVKIELSFFYWGAFFFYSFFTIFQRLFNFLSYFLLRQFNF